MVAELITNSYMNAEVVRVDGGIQDAPVTRRTDAGAPDPS